MKTAVILGSKGQDGKLLCEFLQSKNNAWIGIEPFKVQTHGVTWQQPIDITCFSEVRKLIQTIQPQEVYHLAAVHHSSEEDIPEGVECVQQTYKVNFFSLVNFLEAIRLDSPTTRLFYAASSHLFGNDSEGIQDENTPVQPTSIYAMSKADGFFACRMYRTRYGIFASTGILYNHESHYRSEKFLSKKIICGALDIQAGKQDKLILGDFQVEVDWGYAPDYIEAMHAILSLPNGDEFVIATGRKKRVLDFVQTTFQLLELDWSQYVQEKKDILHRERGVSRIGNPQKLMKLTGWKPKTSFEEMIKLMLQKERLQRHKESEK